MSITNEYGYLLLMRWEFSSDIGRKLKKLTTQHTTSFDWEKTQWTTKGVPHWLSCLHHMRILKPAEIGHVM